MDYLEFEKPIEQLREIQEEESTHGQFRKLLIQGCSEIIDQYARIF